MKYLEELEGKVLGLVAKNKELQDQLTVLNEKNEALTEQIRQFEASLLKETTVARELSFEKETIMNTIEDLLRTIDTLEQPH